MKDWFTVEKIDEDTYAISEYQHWEETHCYLLCGTKRALLIDTGLGVANIKEVVDKLTMLPIFVVTTHVHWDHIGGHQYFENIGVHILEKDWISEKFPISLQQVKRNLTCRECQFPEEFDLEKRVFVFGRLDLFRVFGYFLSYDRSEAILAICKKSAVFTFETYLAGTSQLFGFDRFGRQD